ncbi:MAG: hypothetical protein HOO06_11480 [Bdellovibrionaceae bacterium]|jgi:copper chaperone NosL|nr:hypothetical protein [Pseudobdellovibrionaceae bacterium]
MSILTSVKKVTTISFNFKLFFSLIKKLIWISFFILISCTAKINLDEEPKIVWDREHCTHCHMAVSDRRYATQIRDSKGKTYFFDDIGCAVEWTQKHSDIKVHKTWIRDKTKDKWLDSKHAHWTSGAQTPMGYGFAASEKASEGSFSFAQLKSTMKNKNKKQKSTNK